jgi:hypothetical protein
MKLNLVVFVTHREEVADKVVQAIQEIYDKLCSAAWCSVV